MAAQQQTGEIEQKRPSLWSLTGDEQILEAIVSDADTDDEARVMAQQFLSDNRQAQEEKVDAYCGVITQMQARAKARKEEADRLAELARLDANRAKGMVATLKEWWVQRGLTGRLETARHRVSLVKNGGAQPLEIDEPQLPLPYYTWTIPGEQWEQLLQLRRGLLDVDVKLAVYLRGIIDTIRIAEPERERIRKALEAGEEVPGARLGERGESLRIK